MDREPYKHEFFYDGERNWLVLGDIPSRTNLHDQWAVLHDPFTNDKLILSRSYIEAIRAEKIRLLKEEHERTGS